MKDATHGLLKFVDHERFKLLGLAIGVMLLLFVTGCPSMRKAITDISNENIKNVKMMRKVASECRADYLWEAGFVKAVLGNRINELPSEDVQALEELKQLAEQTEVSDYELGRFLGLKLRLAGSVVQAVLERHTPAVAELLPLVF